MIKLTPHNLTMALTALLMTFSAGIANAEYSEEYYSAMNGKKKEALKSAAKQCVQSHKRLDYYNLPNQWQYSDVYPELVDGCKRWWEMYSNQVYLIRPGQTPTQSYSANKMQREHSIPKSWWKQNGDVEYTPAYSDMWNLYPSDGSANQAKSNYPFGIVATTSFDNGCTKVGGAVTGYGGGSAKVFEPADEYKGDFARSIFYMATVYDDLPWVINYMFVKESWPTLRPWAYEMLLQWSRKDPVSQKEIVRNNSVDQSQGNRNPFIDFPELAEYIWGTRTSETFYIAEQGGNPTPPITGDPELTAPVTGSALDFGQTAIGNAQTAYLIFSGKNFTSPLSLRISGTDRSMFTLSETSILPSAINTNDKYMLPIVFTPTSTGVKSANIIIYDGGLDGSISVTLRGEGCPVPQLSKLTALDATDITATSYTAHWTAAPEAVDYYVVTRTCYLEDGPETSTIESDTNTLLIEGRDANVMETYSVQSSRLGILSDPSNTIVVSASGVDAISEEEPMLIGTVDGGFAIIANPGGDDLYVYNTNGTIVKICKNPQIGEEVLLPNGIFIVTSPSLGRPMKIVVL
ncbi:MAG: endonuclease [Clostridium sp.]|nr:endonuclease [Prevotella sp.]MCM1428507.1 endonuclease [Clostridium sp.]